MLNMATVDENSPVPLFPLDDLVASLWTPQFTHKMELKGYPNYLKNETHFWSVNQRQWHVTRKVLVVHLGHSTGWRVRIDLLPKWRTATNDDPGIICWMSSSSNISHQPVRCSDGVKYFSRSVNQQYQHTSRHMSACPQQIVFTGFSTFLLINIKRHLKKGNRS